MPTPMVNVVRCRFWELPVTMLVEIVAGFSFNSMALTADGRHMGTHTDAEIRKRSNGC